MSESVVITPGLEITVRALRWDAEWEFDCPVAIIAPVFRCHEDGCSLDYAVESFGIDCCIDGKIAGHDNKFWDEGRGWSMEYLKRKFYRKWTQTLVQKIRFVLDEDGELSFEIVSEKRRRA